MTVPQFSARECRLWGWRQEQANPPPLRHCSRESWWLTIPFSGLSPETHTPVGSAHHANVEGFKFILLEEVESKTIRLFLGSTLHFENAPRHDSVRQKALAQVVGHVEEPVLAASGPL